MGTLASALRPIAEELAAAPRVYVDANMPAGVVEAMRRQLHWDVLFVLEHDDLRRASDREHFDRARDYSRTLITLDRDFARDDRFPPAQSAGVIVCSAPDEAGLLRLMCRIDREVFRAADAGATPLRGRMLLLAPGGAINLAPAGATNLAPAGATNLAPAGATNTAPGDDL